MSTAAVSSSSISQQRQQYFQTRTTDLRQLGQALQSGNLSAARTAFSNIATLGKIGPVEQRADCLEFVGWFFGNEQRFEFDGRQLFRHRRSQRFGLNSQASRRSRRGPALPARLLHRCIQCRNQFQKAARMHRAFHRFLVAE
jgi:hypothetical protein